MSVQLTLSELLVIDMILILCFSLPFAFEINQGMTYFDMSFATGWTKDVLIALLKLWLTSKVSFDPVLILFLYSHSDFSLLSWIQ